MIEHKSLRFTIIIVICISVLFGILSNFKIQYQFYLWELFVDTKIIALMLLLLFLHKKNTLQYLNIKLLLSNWNFKKNIAFFFLPLFFYATSIFVGLLFKETSLNKLDNTSTLILATIFDIPAIFVFSMTSILVEEIFFRGFILSTILQKRSLTNSIILTNLLWVVYSVSEIIGIEEINVIKFILLLLFFLSVGILCSAVTERYRSIWFGYSLRVGLITLTPIVITTLLSDSDSFFTTESLIFNAEGMIVSFILLLSSFIFYRAAQKILDQQQEKLQI